MKIVIKTDQYLESHTNILLKLLRKDLQAYSLYDANLLRIDDRYFVTIHSDETDRDRLHKDLTAYLHVSPNDISMTD